MLELQRGVLSFQSILLKNIKNHPELVKSQAIYKEVCNGLLRLCSYPTRKEAEMIGQLEYDQNFGANVLNKIISEGQLSKFYEQDFDSYYSKNQGTGANWFSGINSIKYPSIYLKNIFLGNRKYKYLALTEMCNKSIEYSQERDIALVGAGENGRMMILIYYYLGLKKPVFLLDNNVNINNSNIGRITIYEISKTVIRPDIFYVFSVTNMDAYVALKEQIEKMAGNIHFISYFEENR